MMAFLSNVLGVIVLLIIILGPWILFDVVIIVAHLTAGDDKTLENKWFLWTILFPIALTCEILKLIDKLKDFIHNKKWKLQKNLNSKN